MRFKYLLLITFLGLLVSCTLSNPQVSIGCDVTELIDAINNANATPSTTNIINLTAPCSYDLIAVNNSTFGDNGLPVIVSPIIINGNGASIEREIAAPPIPRFRIFHVAANGSLELNDVTLAVGAAEGNFFGGAIHSMGSLTINNSTLNGNRAEMGGAIYAHGMLTITNSTFVHNRAVHGGGIYYEGAIGTSMSVDLSGFYENRAIFEGDSGRGGAIYTARIEETNVTISKSTFHNNEAFAGGAVANDAPGEMSITWSSFTENEANPGGAINNRAVMTITDSTIANNAASLGGGIITDGTLWEGALTIINSTVSGNSIIGFTQKGAGIYNKAGELHIRYSSITENAGGSPALYVDTSGTADVQNTIIGNNPSGDCGGAGYTSFGGNLDSDGSCPGFTITDDPLLGPLANNGGPTFTHALFSGSPAIDAALSSCEPADQRGISRPKGASCDLGAYEFEETTSGPIGIATPYITPFVVTVIPIITPTPTLILEPFGNIPELSLCWLGPGDPYAVVSSLQPGTRVELLGTGEGGGYLVVNNPRYNLPCWVREADVDIGGFDVFSLPVVKIPPLPTKTPTIAPLGCLVPLGTRAGSKCEVPCPDPKKYPQTCTP